MLDRITGTLVGKPPAGAVLDVGGVAFAIAVPMSSWEKLPALGERATLFTYLYVREDALLLFGFDSSLEREAFVMLIAVNGVGPKTALAILSRYDRDELAEVVSAGDVRRLQAVPGIGRKTAERLLIELKDRLGTPTLKGAPMTTGVGVPSVVSDAVRALETLGFTLQQADEAVRRARGSAGESASVEELVRRALKGR